MSFSGTISNALSGLRASTRAAELVASNLANATNENYAARSLVLASRRPGGVAVTGVSRSVDAALLGDWRLAQAETAEAGTANSYLTRVERIFGTPETPGALTDLVTRFESSLVAAAARPDLSLRLEEAVYRAGDLTAGLQTAARGLQSLRGEVDSEIQRSVEALNRDLQEVAALNSRIVSATARGEGAETLQDLRQATIDRIAEIVPLRVLARDREAVALVTTSGAVLLEGTAAQLEFEAAPLATEFKTLENGGLSGLMLEGSVLHSPDISRIGAGRLSALFDLRDDGLVRYQREVDALARDLAARFQSTGLDPTIPPGAPGLFTDGGTAFEAGNETGFARRIALNPQVDPAEGGAAWRLRDGLQATTPGPSGEGSLILAMIDRLAESTTVASGGQSGLALSVTGLASRLLSAVGADLTRNEDRLSFASARSHALTEQKLQQGVDSDAELQNLMQIENAYAANAQVLRAVDEMIDVLLGVS